MLSRIGRLNSTGLVRVDVHGTQARYFLCYRAGLDSGSNIPISGCTSAKRTNHWT
jgi:hypothetical protein